MNANVAIKKNNGFTLIELMIASSLLMLVMYAGYFAYSLYSNSWQKQSAAFWKSTDAGVNFTLLIRVVEGAKPYIVNDRNDKPSIYFIGSNRSIRFVSSTPIFADEPAVVELWIEEDKLLYRESLLLGSPLINQLDTRIWHKAIVLLTGITQAGFSYFGWSGLNQIQEFELQQAQQLRGQAPILPAHYSNHYMEDVRFLPIALIFSYVDKDGNELVQRMSLPNYSHFSLYKYLREGI